MSYILKVVRPANLQNWIATNAPASLKAHPKDSWRAYLSANGGTGQTLRDLEMSFLAAQGYTQGTLNDRWSAYNSAQTGSTTADKCRNRYK